MDERSRLFAEARALLEWESELGGIGLRRRPASQPASGAARSASRGTEGRDTPAVEPAAAGAPSPQGADGSLRPAEAARRPAPASPEERLRRLAVLADEVAGCTACRLHEGRTKAVFGRGSHGARVVFVGEGPGYHEDQQGLPFVGESGQLLDRMIAAMGLGPADFYICNVVKCRPPENRTPEPDEMTRCTPFLAEQLDVVAPEIIVALGRTAAEALSAVPGSGRGWRGQWASYRGIRVMPTYHPAFLLRNADKKREVWDDLQRVMAVLGTRGTR